MTTYKGHTITKTSQTGSRADGKVHPLYKIEGEHGVEGFAALKANLFSVRACREYIDDRIEMADL